MTFSKKYLVLFLSLLAVEICIAVFTFHWFIRGFLGDVLVILLIYCFVRIFLKGSAFKIALTTLVFAIGVELLQWIDFTEKLNITSPVFKTMLGSVFDPWDILAYLLGFFIVVISEKSFLKFTK
ncbi:DUF2809 domain-containing protein [Altibacter sp.]|uniref:ribosomal maturation YjgA family protein n=1 Tax=Altibacter sp. TaxID=2024823 RepID=UPI000C89F8DC|nr:DUF2809 domain-containing protein [Altibacter sp.]MAP54607.1 hypothetical protein [Altibacter sp.]